QEARGAKRLSAEDERGSRDLRGARRRRAARVRAGDAAADGAALFPLLMERLELPFELRQKSRLRARLASGEEVGLMLARGTVMRGGDVVTAIDGREVEIVAAKERLLHIESDHLARVAYHLGT